MRPRRTGWWIGAFGLLAVSSVAGAQGAEDPLAAVEPGVETSRQAGSVIKSLVVEGSVEAWTPLIRRNSEPSLVVASRMGGEEKAPLGLHLWTLDGEPGWRTLQVDMPSTLDSLGSYVRDDEPGEPLILVFGDAKLRVLSTSGRIVGELDMPNGFYPFAASGWMPESDRGHIYRRLGALESLRFGRDWHELESVWRIELPILVDRTSRDLRLRTPPVIALASRLGSGTLFAVGPQAVGPDRLRTMLIDAGSATTPQTTELWSRFAEPETVEESWYVEFDDAPAMIVTTVLTDRHGVFEKKKLRLFRLERDRSRLGSSPILEVITRSRNWYPTCAGVGDINDDQRDDIVSAQPAGMGGGKLWVAAYLSHPSGVLESKPIGTMLQVELGEGCSLEHDFDRDGRPDLLVSTGGELLIYSLSSGEASEKGGWMAPSPTWRVALDDIREMPEVGSLYPDGSAQIISSGRTEAGHGRISVIRLE